ELCKVMADNFFTSISCQTFGSAVYAGVISLEIVNVNGVSRVLKQLAITLFALAQRHFSALAFCHTLLKFRHMMLAFFEQLSISNSSRSAFGERLSQAQVLWLKEKWFCFVQR